MVCSTLDRVVWVRALVWYIVLCSWARHFTLTVSLSPQVFKLVLANLLLGRNHDDGLASHPGGSRNTSSRFMLQKPDISSSLMCYLALIQILPYFSTHFRLRIFLWIFLYFGVWHFCRQWKPDMPVSSIKHMTSVVFDIFWLVSPFREGKKINYKFSTQIILFKISASSLFLKCS